MEAMRQSWTDDRLDDLSHRMDDRFDQVEGEIKGPGKELRDEMAGMEVRLRAQASEHYVRTGEELAKVREEMRDDRQQLVGEMQALQRTIIQVGWAGAITLVAGVAGALVAQLF